MPVRRAVAEEDQAAGAGGAEEGGVGVKFASPPRFAVIGCSEDRARTRGPLLAVRSAQKPVARGRMSHPKSATRQFAAFLLCTLAAGAFAQQPASSPSLPAAQPPQTAPDSSAPTLKVKTQLTLEDVTVTDDKGQAGAWADAVRLQRQRRRQAADHQELPGVREGAKHAGCSAPKLPPNVYTNQQARQLTVRSTSCFSTM